MLLLLLDRSIELTYSQHAPPLNRSSSGSTNTIRPFRHFRVLENNLSVPEIEEREELYVEGILDPYYLVRLAFHDYITGCLRLTIKQDVDSDRMSVEQDGNCDRMSTELDDDVHMLFHQDVRPLSLH